jgi:hypothetical protein
MANWAKHIEDTVGLEVVKRAKHGIHFDKGNGEVLANFVGKPCHYQDGGLWKPIDTKLLLMPDGFYGCPHSPVRISKEGRVKVDGTSYTQYTELPSATGLVDNDRIVRTFSFGEQRMWVTEDGYRSESQLNRIPTLAEARKVITSESGKLSKSYLKSLTTATDANGDTHTVSTLSAFRTWLASAKFPVVIDPDFSTTSTAGDTFLESGGNATKNYGQKDVLELTLASTSKVALMKFDCSSISADATASAATLALTKTTQGTANAGTLSAYGIASANGNWIEGTKNGTTAGAGEPCWNAKEADGAGGVTTAWAGSDGCQTAGTDYINTLLGSGSVQRSDAAGTAHTITFNSDGYVTIKTWFGSNDANYGLWIGASNGQSYYASAEHATEGYRPVFTVTYSVIGLVSRKSLLGVGK